MKHVTLLAPRHTTPALLEWLQEEGLVHVEDAAGRLAEAEDLKRPVLSAEEEDAHVHRLQLVLRAFEELGAARRSLAQSLVSLRTRVGRNERSRVLRQFDYVSIYEQCMAAVDGYQRHQKAVEAARTELESLEFFRTLPFGPPEVRALRRTRAWIGTLPLSAWVGLCADPEAAEVLAFQELWRERRKVHICALALRTDEDRALGILRRHGLSERPVPELEGDLRARLEELRQEVRSRQAARDQCAGQVRQLAQHRRELEIVLGYWQARRARIQAQNRMAQSRRIAVLCGFVRQADLPRLQEGLRSRFAAVSAISRDPKPGDRVPVSLSHSRLLKPMRFLVDMFGLPDYFSFDPTPYLSLSFLVFFGMCFGDVVYGLLLCAVAGYLARKSRGYEGLNNMCMLFFYCGISTVLFGLLTGSWASDLWRPEYLGQGNPIQWLKERTAVLDPLEKAVGMLLACLGLGVASQFYGLILKGYGLLRRGDLWGAVFDVGLWLLAIPAFLGVASALFVELPGRVFRAALAVLILAGIGLVLTQGRQEKNVFARIVTGLVSLYGITGSYGCMSFVADVLSYSRLLALGLTTTVVGMSFNVVAGLVREVPWAGLVLFAVVVAVGHLFNFAVSIIGSFVHPARLIFLEFFNRFYELGGVRFTPLSLDTETVIVES